MAGAYDDRDGWIWMDGALVPWRDARVHVLTHALHYASSVFEGERCYNGKIFKGREHSARLLKSGELLDMVIPYTVDQIEEAKYAMLKANGWTDAYVRAVAWRGSGEDMGVSAMRNPVRMAVAGWEWGAYYGDAKMKGAKLDISKWKRPSPETIPVAAKAAGLVLTWRGQGVDTEAVDAASGNVVIRINPEFYRPAEVDLLLSDPRRAYEKLNWVPKISFEELASRMMLSDLKAKGPLSP